MPFFDVFFCVFFLFGSFVVLLKFVFFSGYSISLILVFLLVCCQQPEPKENENEEDQFSKHIRTTSAKSPQEEKLALKVPPGCKIELFASEPDIGKPMNMSFDAKGRMWEYPK